MYSHNKDNIEFVLTYTDNLKRAIYEAENDPNLPKTGGGNGHSRVSDPTAAKAIRDIMGAECVTVYYGCKMSKTIRNPRKWLKVALDTKEGFKGTIYEKIIERRFKEYPDKIKDICKELGISSPYYKLMLKEIFMAARGIAIGQNLITPKF